MHIKTLLLVLSVFFLATSAHAQPPGPPVSEPVDVNVLNFPDVQTIDGTVSVSNLPQDLLAPFARQCLSLSDDDCSIDVTDLTGMGEVHITQVSGQAINVGSTASPRFSVGGGTELNLPFTVNSLDAGVDRDIQFSQSMDVIPVGTNIRFLEVDSTEVFFKVAGYVVGSPAAASAANSSAAMDAAVSSRESTREP